MATQDRGVALGRLASTQHGVFTRRQAFDAGFTRGEIDGRVHRGVWVAVDYGVYRAVETPISWHQRLMAACLAGPALASHRAAAALWQLTDYPADLIEVTSVRHRRRWKSDVAWHESTRIDEREVTEIARIPVTSATRTILDLAGVVDQAALLRAMDDAARRRLTSFDRLEAEIDRWDRRRIGISALRSALLLRRGTPIPESALETEFDELIRRYGLPRPSRQWVIRKPSGEFLARVDFAYPAARLAIELQSIEFHAGWDGRLRDMQRENDLASVDWRVLQFTAEHVRRRPDYVKTKILDALRVERALLDPPHAVDLRNQ